MACISRFKSVIPTLIFVGIVGFFHPSFLRPQSLLQLASDISPIFIMALGMTFVIMIGSIDLSLQSIANMTTVVVTALLVHTGPLSPLIAILVGTAFGACSGALTACLKMPSFIVTLATGGVAYSAAQYLSGERALYMDGDFRHASLGWLVGTVGGMPREIVFAGVILILAVLIEKRTVVGRVLRAIGAGEPAVVASGISVVRYKIIAFALSGALGAAAGVMLAIRSSGGSPTMADQFLLPTIVAVLVGGTPLTGGVGGVLNTLLGALIVALIRTSMIYVNVPPFAQQIFFGGVLIAAIALTIDRRKLRTIK